MGLYGPGGTGNDPAGSSNSSGNATGSGGGSDGSGYGGGWGSDWGGTAADWASSDVLGPDQLGGPGMGVGGAQTQINTGTGSENNSTNWGLVGQAASLGMAVLGLPGAVMGGLLGWGLQQGAFTGPSTAVAEKADTNGDGNDGAARTVSSSASSSEAAASEASTETSQASESTDSQQITDAANQAEEQERKRKRYGYMESISGEENVEMSMLWNPNISAMGTPGFIY